MLSYTLLQFFSDSLCLKAITIIEMKGIARCKLAIISESAISKKFLGQIVSYPAILIVIH
jgi:hypothetical protein